MKNIQEAYISMYMMVTEAVHPEIQSIMDSDTMPLSYKTKQISTKLSQLGKAGEDSGLESGKPKRGSSRAVYFPKEEKKITVDGQETSTPTAIKIAFMGELDRHHGEDSLLGQDQNDLEGDHYIQKTHSVLRENHDGKYETNPDGVLAPIFDKHPEGHHLEMGRVEKYNAKDLANYTKTKEFPKGLTHQSITDAMMREHNDAHGSYIKDYSPEETEKHDKIIEHPFVENMINMMHDSGMHPGDLIPRNMGIYVHPVTKVRHPVIIDYGFSNDIAKKYRRARQKMSLSY